MLSLSAILLDLKFPKVLYKKILNQPVELQDLLDIDEAKVNGYVKLLSFEVEGDEQVRRKSSSRA